MVRRSWRCIAWAVALVLGWVVAGRGAGPGQVLGAADWPYQDLDKLARAGLVSGHPTGPLSAWTNQLTRFEAASLTLRAVAGLGEAYQAQGEALRRSAQAPAGETAAVAPRPVTAEDLARVEKLIGEFRAELVTMGVRVDDLDTAIREVQQRLVKLEAEQKKHRIDGYMQLRWRDDAAPDGKQEFLVRRTRLNLRGPVSERTSYRVELQADARDVYASADGKEKAKTSGSKVQLRTAYVDYELSPQTRLRFGQAILPWGYELETAVPALWTGERSLWMDRLFPEQRDIGGQLSYQRSPRTPKLDLALVNGTGINASDNNDRKNVLARVDLPVRSGTVALSSYWGEDGTGAAATDQNRFGVSANLSQGKAQFLGEFVTGRDRGHNMRGWYAQLGHPVAKGKPNLLFAKYDQYDENDDRGDDLFRRWSLGYWLDLDPATRVTLVYELRDVEPLFSELSKWHGNAAYLQLQVKY